MPLLLKRLFPNLPNFIAVRSKYPQETGRSASQLNSPTAEDVSSTRPRPSEVVDLIQLVSPLVQAAAEVIPVAGSPLKAAIGGLLQIIQIIDVGCLSYRTAFHLISSQTKNRNKAAIPELASRVHQLSVFLSMQPEPRNELEAQRRKDLTK
jgi:hypothetical protein